jgi:hypothetical protein
MKILNKEKQIGRLLSFFSLSLHHRSRYDIIPNISRLLTVSCATIRPQMKDFNIQREGAE